MSKINWEHIAIWYSHLTPDQLQLLKNRLYPLLNDDRLVSSAIPYGSSITEFHSSPAEMTPLHKLMTHGAGGAPVTVVPDAIKELTEFSCFDRGWTTPALMALASYTTDPGSDMINGVYRGGSTLAQLVNANIQAGGSPRYAGNLVAYVRDIVTLTAFATVAHRRCLPVSAPYAVGYRAVRLDHATQGIFGTVGQRIPFANTFSAAMGFPSQYFVGRGNTVLVAITNSEDFVSLEGISSVLGERELLGVPGTDWITVASRIVNVRGNDKLLVIVKPARDSLAKSITTLWMH
jgi:hypothetical protein